MNEYNSVTLLQGMVIGFAIGLLVSMAVDWWEGKR